MKQIYDSKHLTVFSSLWWFCWLHTKTRSSKLGDAVAPPGLWATSGLLSHGCSQQDLSRKSTLVRPCVQKIFWAQGSDQRSQGLSIRRRSGLIFKVLRIPQLRTLLRSVTLWILRKTSTLWKLPFCDHRAIKLTQNCVCSTTNPCINLPVPSVTRDDTLRYLNFWTCCSVLQLTCSVFWLRLLKRHIFVVLALLVFIPVWLKTAENRSVHAEDRVQKGQAAPNLLQKANDRAASNSELRRLAVTVYLSN